MFAYDLGDGAALRPLEPWQAEEFSAHVDRARAHLEPWIPFPGRVVDVASAQAFLQRFAERLARDDGRIYGIWVDGVLSGGTLFPVFDAPGRRCEIGVWLAPEVQGRGLITRSVRLMIDWAIRERGIFRVEWHNDPVNEPSRAVARRLGMTREGILRSSFMVRGELKDTEVWSLLAPEWTSGADLDNRRRAG